MASKINSVQQYFTDGCGRCKYFQMPQCKVHRWKHELIYLREIILSAGLTEEIKWSMPCYTYNGKNILILAALKEYCSIGFFKGALIKDAKKILVAPGENSNVIRQLRFTALDQIEKLESVILKYIKEAIQIELSGEKIEKKVQQPEDILEELKEAFKTNPKLEMAFYALTPGRQRGYLMHFSTAKQSATRQSRIKKFIPKILAGKGFQD